MFSAKCGELEKWVNTECGHGWGVPAPTLLHFSFASGFPVNSRPLVSPKSGPGAGVGVGRLRGRGSPCIEHEQVAKFLGFLVSWFLRFKVFEVSWFLGFRGFLVSSFQISKFQRFENI